MKKIIQFIPAVANLYAVWKEESDNEKRYGVDRSYYLGLDDNGEVYPLVIDGSDYIDTFAYDEYMVFDWNGYQWWKMHEADLPVYEYFNRFEREQREKSIKITSDILFGRKENT